MKPCICVLLILLWTRVVGQEYQRTETDFSRLTDDLLGYQDGDMAYEDIYENYVQLFSNPIDLNKAGADELRSLNILSDEQIRNILEYKAVNGNFLSVYELQSVPGFDLNTIYKIIPFVTIAGNESSAGSLLNRIFDHGNTYIVTRYERRLESSRGYDTNETDENKFQGSPDKVYMRIRSSKANDFSFGLTSEKDAGEKIQWNPSDRTYGTDYVSYHAQLLNKKRLKNLIVGDFQCQYGQGLLLGNAFGLGKGGETVSTLRKSYSGFLPYTSVNEAGYMRGIASSYQLQNRIFLSGFYSNTKRDASVSDSEFPVYSSINVTGLHRNLKELNQRKTVTEEIYGGVLQYKHNLMEAGIIFQAIHFSIPVLKDPTPYNQFAFRGDRNQNGSAFLNYTVHNINFFGEAGKTYGAGSGVVAGMLSSLHSNLDMALVYRNYEKDFHTFYANAFAENTTPQNETGMYWGWKYRINKKYNVGVYVDLFRFPWLKFRTYKPSQGHEFLARVNYSPSRKVSMFVQVRYETKEQNVGDDTNLYATAPALKNNLWLNFDYSLHPNMKMKTRAQFSGMKFNNEGSSGMTLAQDISFNFRRLQLSARYALFDTDDFDNRQYVYENDVWLAYSLPAYNGEGVRSYLVIEYKLSKHITTWLRYSVTKHEGREEVGSGLDVISRNKINDVKFQLRITL